jgi:thiamine pyrophosphokinase
VTAVHVLVVANGDTPSLALMRELAARAALVVAADGGADRALACGIRPAFVVGDLDSVTAAARAELGGAAFVSAPDPDSTDLQKAVQFAVDRGATSIDIVCAGGGRIDHELANLSLLTLSRNGPPVHLHDDSFEVSLVAGETVVDGPPGTVVSLLAIGQCLGVTTRGLRWDLQDYALAFSPYGVHNEIASPPATVTVASGDLLLFRGRWVEHHG